MKEQSWEIDTFDGDTVVGTDRFPTPDERSRTNRFRLALPFMDGVISFVIPDGGELVFFRENEIRKTGDVETRSYSYYVGYSYDARKVLTRIDPIRLGERTAPLITILHDDGRK